MASNKVWRTESFAETWTGVSWPGTQLGSLNHLLVYTVPAGQTIVRSRLQIHVALGCNNLTPATTALEPDLLGGSHLDFGLYFNPSGGTGYAPQAADNVSRDSNWLQLNGLTLTSEVYYETSDSIVHMLGVFTSGSEPFDSQGQRGPATVNSDCYMAWVLGASSTYWTENTANLSGRGGWRARVDLLVDTSPP